MIVIIRLSMIKSINFIANGGDYNIEFLRMTVPEIFSNFLSIFTRMVSLIAIMLNITRKRQS